MAVVGCGPRAMAEPQAQAAPTAVDIRTLQAMREVPISMYMTSWCPVCAKAHAWLEREGYRFVELNVEEDEHAAYVHRAFSPRGSVPMFDVEGTILIGFDPQLLRAVVFRAARDRETATR